MEDLVRELVADADGICTARCTADDACPEGYSCADVATGWHIGRKGCVPENNDCSFDAPPLPEVVLNEVLADPPAELAGDANGDGLRDDAGDQFVELLNISALEADLAGWTISDGQKVRFTFPNGTILAPGGAAVVFGAAPGEAFSAPEGVQVFTAKEGLMLDAEGDSVLLHRPGDHLEDSLVFGAEGSGARSLVRPSDGEAGATWEAHPGELLFSPGTQSDGSPF